MKNEKLDTTELSIILHNELYNKVDLDNELTTLLRHSKSALKLNLIIDLKLFTELNSELSLELDNTLRLELK